MTNTNAVNLKPCPFCGNHNLNYYRLNYHGDKWCIRCDAEECFVKPHAVFDTDLNKSATLWNRRYD